MTNKQDNKQQAGKPADRSKAKRSQSVVRNGGVTVLPEPAKRKPEQTEAVAESGKGE